MHQRQLAFFLQTIVNSKAVLLIILPNKFFQYALHINALTIHDLSPANLIFNNFLRQTRGKIHDAL